MLPVSHNLQTPRFMPSFTEQLWSGITPVYRAILDHPFLRGLTSGELPEASFRHYVVQDSLYLKAFGRALAVLAARSDDDNQMMLFCDHAKNTLVVERALHQGFLEGWGLSMADVEATPPAPNCMLYTSYLLRVAYSRPAWETLGAVLPCYWIYREVGKALRAAGSPHALYQRWIDTYGGEEFGQIVDAVLAVAEQVAAPLTPEQREAMAGHFGWTARMEYKFWDMGYRRQEWERFDE